MGAVARAAGVSKGLLHYHFDSKEHLLLEAVRATFRQLHSHFDDRFRSGDRGLETATEGLHALWQAFYEMRGLAPFMVETMSLATHDGPLRSDIDAFYAESTELLAEGIAHVFADCGQQLTLPPERWARLVRVNLHGLVVELAYARTDAELAEVEQSYRDLVTLFQRVAFEPAPAGTLPVEASP
jgi:AcrR family transcriptional regulator